jgi:hypothetical protein
MVESPEATRRRAGRKWPSVPALALLLICGSLPAAPVRGPFPGAPLLISLPLTELPYGLGGGFDSPSMQQSLRAEAGVTQLADQSIGWLWEGVGNGFLRSLGSTASLAAFSYLSFYLPPGDGWMHEEWHRAVFTRYDIPSYNGVYHWDIGASTISVDHVTDKDLEILKADHPADFTRLSEAGIEGEIESGRLMRKDNFFLGRDSRYDILNWWITSTNVTAYIYECATDDLDQDLKDANAAETRESQRDFTGLDFRAWVHDLHHPEEPYAQGPRGRPRAPGAGTGFDRYLLYSDLSAEERGYLKLQAGLSLLNLVSPQMFGRDWLPGTNPWDGQGFLWNFGLVHHLTPFGYEVAGDFLARRGKWEWVFTLQGMVNGRMALPGLSGELFRYPVTVGRTELHLSGGASLWLQPEDQLFATTSVTPGASVSVGAAVPLRAGLEAFVEANAKSEGWVPGDVYLDAALEGRMGLQLRI